jgi:tetratricopeptide (TPR) repeat protein
MRYNRRILLDYLSLGICMKLTGLIVSFLVVVVVVLAYVALDSRLRLEAIENSLDVPQIEEDAFILERAEQAVGLAFNLLGLFEALSLAITIGGVVITVFGLTRFTNASNELEEARKLVERELEDARNRFETAIGQREAELKEMRQELEQEVHDDRQRTADALLANALIPLGERQYKTSDYKGALSTYDRALELDPLNPVINQRLGYVYTQTGELEKAKYHYEKAIEREKNFAPALAGLGYVFRRFGENIGTELGKADFTEDVHLHKTIERDQMLNRSEDLLLQALDLSPKLVDDDGESYWGILGGLYKRRGQIDQAIDAYKKVTEVTPQSSYGYGNLALLYQKKNDRPAMLKTYERVEQIASKEAVAEAGNFWGYSDLIVSSFAVGKMEQAKNALPIAISIAPIDSPYMLQGLTDTLRELENFLEAEKLPVIEEAIGVLVAEMERRQSMGAE